MRNQKKRDWCGDTSLTETTDAGTCSVSSAMIPQKTSFCNGFSPAVSSLLDQATERQEWHAERAAECRRDIRFYQASLGWHQDQAERAAAIRAELERMVL